MKQYGILECSICGHPNLGEYDHCSSCGERLTATTSTRLHKCSKCNEHKMAPWTLLRTKAWYCNDCICSSDYSTFMAMGEARLEAMESDMWIRKCEECGAEFLGGEHTDVCDDCQMAGEVIHVARPEPQPVFRGYLLTIGTKTHFCETMTELQSRIGYEMMGEEKMTVTVQAIYNMA